jgi:predicted aspartyl protease
MDKKTSGLRLALWFGIFVAIHTLAGHAANSDSRVSFRLVRNYLVVVPVRINGEGPFDFILDTGTNTTVVTPELASQLKLKPTGQVSLITPSGAKTVPRAILENLKMGTKPIERLEVIYDGLQGVRSIDRNIHGILGQNFLCRFNYLLQYPKRQIEFEENGEWEGKFQGTQLPVFEDEGKQIVVTLAGAPFNSTLRFVLDSAASDLVIFASVASTMELDAERGGSFLLTASSRSSPVRMQRIQALQIGSERLFNIKAAVVQYSELIPNRSEDGLLPTSLFDTIVFQNDKHMVILNPKVKENPSDFLRSE